MCIAANVSQKLSCSQAESDPDNHVSSECPAVVCIGLCTRFTGSFEDDAICVRDLEHLPMRYKYFTG